MAHEFVVVVTEVVTTPRAALDIGVNGAVDDVGTRFVDGGWQRPDAQCWLDVQSRFHDFSINNQLLPLKQKPDATRVAGYRTWQDLGRQVQSGESAIRIWAPIITAKCPECGNIESYHDRDGHDCASHIESDPDQWEEGVVGFRPTSVYDISRTEGDPLADLETAAIGDGRLACFIRRVQTVMPLSPV